MRISDWSSDVCSSDLLANTNQQIHDPIGARVLADGTLWFTLSCFDGDPDSADATALTPLIAAMRADRPATRAATRLGLALRSNNGGSSDTRRRHARRFAVRHRREVLEGCVGGVGQASCRGGAGNVKKLS